MKRGALLAALALLAAAVWSWRARRDAPSGEASSPAGTRHTPPGGSVPRFAAPPTSAPAKPPAETTRDPSPPPLTAQSGPGPYLEIYRGLSGRLPAGTRPDGAEPTTRNVSLAKEPELVAWVPSVRVELGTGTVVHATLTGAGGTVVPDAIEVSIAGADGAVVRAPMTADGGGAGYRHAFHPDAKARATGEGRATRPPARFHYVVRARGTSAGAPFERTAGGLFWVHDPGARLDATSLRLARKGGDIALDAAVTVTRPGRYWAYAELWGGADGTTPVAFARRPLGALPPGRHRVPLLFGGQIVRDSGVDGPYVVRNVRLTQVDTHPPHEPAPLPALAPSPPWPAATFR